MPAGDRLWRWSGEVYRRPGVAEACLWLQDRLGADVNLLLALVWAGAEGRAIDDAALWVLTDATRAWQTDVVTKLRAVRRALTPENRALREQVKAAELEAERIEQDLLAATLAKHTSPSAPGGRALAAENLNIYVRGLKGEDASASVRTLLDGAFATTID